MYENNYNYIDVPEEKEKKKSGAGKTVALILSVALVGGASGFGGAYLQSRLAGQEITAQESISVPALNSKPEGGVNLGDQGVGTVSSLLAADRNGALTTKQIVEKVSPSVVSVHSDFEGQSATGTGIILSETGYIITNAHVIQTEGKERVTDGGRNNINPFSGGYDDIFEYFFGGGVSYKSVLKNADEVTVILSGDEETEYKAEIIGADPYSDIAVLKIEGTGFAAAEFGDSNELTMGDKAVAIGYPLGLGLSTSEGIISGLNRSISVELSGGGTAEMILIQTDAAINPGNSGGPLINEYGQVIGITSSKISTYTVEGMGFAIPITDAMPIISDIMNNNNTTPQIGISGTEINSAYARYYNLPVNKGVMVGSVMEGGAADAAGICAGDIIVAADGKEITSMDDLSAAKARKKVGDKMVLTLARADGNVDVEIILTAEENEEENVGR